MDFRFPANEIPISTSCMVNVCPSCAPRFVQCWTVWNVNTNGKKTGAEAAQEWVQERPMAVRRHPSPTTPSPTTPRLVGSPCLRQQRLWHNLSLNIRNRKRLFSKLAPWLDVPLKRFSSIHLEVCSTTTIQLLKLVLRLGLKVWVSFPLFHQKGLGRPRRELAFKIVYRRIITQLQTGIFSTLQ